MHQKSHISSDLVKILNLDAPPECIRVVDLINNTESVIQKSTIPYSHERRHLYFSEGTWTSLSSQERGGIFTVLNLEDCQFTVCALLSDASTSDKQEKCHKLLQRKKKQWISCNQWKHRRHRSSKHPPLWNCQQPWFSGLCQQGLRIHIGRIDVNIYVMTGERNIVAVAGTQPDHTNRMQSILGIPYWTLA